MLVVWVVIIFTIFMVSSANSLWYLYFAIELVWFVMVNLVSRDNVMAYFAFVLMNSLIGIMLLLCLSLSSVCSFLVVFLLKFGLVPVISVVFNYISIVRVPFLLNYLFLKLCYFIIFRGAVSSSVLSLSALPFQHIITFSSFSFPYSAPISGLHISSLSVSDLISANHLNYIVSNPIALNSATHALLLLSLVSLFLLSLALSGAGLVSFNLYSLVSSSFNYFIVLLLLVISSAHMFCLLYAIFYTIFSSILFAALMFHASPSPLTSHSFYHSTTSNYMLSIFTPRFFIMFHASRSLFDFASLTLRSFAPFCFNLCCFSSLYANPIPHSRTFLYSPPFGRCSLSPASISCFFPYFSLFSTASLCFTPLRSVRLLRLRSLTSLHALYFNFRDLFYFVIISFHIFESAYKRSGLPSLLCFFFSLCTFPLFLSLASILFASFDLCLPSLTPILPNSIYFPRYYNLPSLSYHSYCPPSHSYYNSYAIFFPSYASFNLRSSLFICLGLYCAYFPSSHFVQLSYFNTLLQPFYLLSLISHPILSASVCFYAAYSYFSTLPSSSFNLLDLLSIQPFSALFYFSCSIYFLILSGLFPLYIFYSKLFYILFLSSTSLFLTFALSFLMFFIFSFCFLNLILNML
jgi:hypothetical protein